MENKDERIKKWKSYGEWEEHKDFLIKNGNDIDEVLIYFLKILDDKRAFKYHRIYRIHKIALSKLIGRKL